ncbi:hypothetical protein Fmac_029670 [Flemingia macrophylla]|uniref:Uncharacterized protein n=1 Tax=Flemingia macrophylla TaxID=520843 RepID=A0ABD1LB67_9FABA
MAGLQQYNFFPTDLLYPCPTPQQPSTKPTMLPLQTSNVQDYTHHQQPPRTNATPSTSPLLFTHNTNSIAPVDNTKFSDPLSSLLWIAQDEDDSSHSS